MLQATIVKTEMSILEHNVYSKIISPTVLRLVEQHSSLEAPVISLPF